jgi:hypothetical protein
MNKDDWKRDREALARLVKDIKPRGAHMAVRDIENYIKRIEARRQRAVEVRAAECDKVGCES